jgi:hypothetical protein
VLPLSSLSGVPHIRRAHVRNSVSLHRSGIRLQLLVVDECQFWKPDQFEISKNLQSLQYENAMAVSATLFKETAPRKDQVCNIAAFQEVLKLLNKKAMLEVNRKNHESCDWCYFVRSYPSFVCVSVPVASCL